MSKKNKIFITLFLSMNLIYAVFVFGMRFFDSYTGNQPVISFENDLITVSVDDDEDKLLKDVSAFDDEDGDITKDVFIYSISQFNDDNMRTVTYAVFDSDDQMVTRSRNIKYDDYTAPQFSSSKPLLNISINGTDSSFIGATSCVDGDISNKVSMSMVEKDDKAYYQFNVTDSTGTTSTLEVVDELNFMSILNSNTEIVLKDYILYLNKGDAFNPRKYIKTVETSFGEQNELKSLVTYETNCDVYKEGVYEVKYTINRSNGDYGVTKMIVIVE